MSLKTPKAVFLQVSENTLQKVFKYLGVVFTSDNSQKKGVDTRIGKANAVLRELYCSVVTKRELSKNSKLSKNPKFLNWSLFRSSPVVMNLTWRLKNYCQKNKWQRWDICEEFSVWHVVTKSTGLKYVKLRMSSHFSESGDPSYTRSAMCPKCPRKEWRTKSFGLQSTPTGKRPKVCPRTRWRFYISDLAWYRLGVGPEKQSEIAVDRKVFRVLLGVLLPRLSPKKKRARKWANDRVCTLHWTFLFMKLFLVCLPKVNVVFK